VQPLSFGAAGSHCGLLSLPSRLFQESGTLTPSHFIFLLPCGLARLPLSLLCLGFLRQEAACATPARARQRRPQHNIPRRRTPVRGAASPVRARGSGFPRTASTVRVRGSGSFRPGVPHSSPSPCEEAPRLQPLLCSHCASKGEASSAPPPPPSPPPPPTPLLPPWSGVRIYCDVGLDNTIPSDMSLQVEWVDVWAMDCSFRSVVVIYLS
jgi:hypothetical protein